MKLFRSISAVLLAILVLVSSTSFMVGMHLCMGEVQNVALFDKAGECAKEKALPPCHKHMKPECCDDEVIQHDGSDFKAAVEHYQVTAPLPVYMEQPLVLISEIIPAAPVARIQYYNYSPPLRAGDLTVEHQSFLI